VCVCVCVCLCLGENFLEQVTSQLSSENRNIKEANWRRAKVHGEGRALARTQGRKDGEPGASP
jgi:hypothetical protein